MSRRRLWMVFVTLVTVASTACGAGTSNPTPSPTPVTRATSFAEYAIGFCSAWESLFRAVGNPDTAAGSELSNALDAAVEAGDGKEAERLATEITTELESGRQAITFAGGWPPATPMMTQLDRLFVGYEKMTAAHVPLASGVAGAIDPQAAFEQSGAIDAWSAFLEAYQALGSQRPAGTQPCGDLPIGP